MITYQSIFEPDREAGGFVITFPDFDWGVSQADTEADALAMAEDLLVTMLGDHIKQSQEIPIPKRRRGSRYRDIRLPALQSAKVELYRVFCASGLRKAELARRIGIPKSNFERLFNLRHHSRLNRQPTFVQSIQRDFNQSE